MSVARLHCAQRPSPIDAQLTVGAATQEVVVKTEVPLLQTESGAQSNFLESKQLLQLPQVGADWQNFVTLLPGASSVNYRTGQTASINGNLPYNTVLADGATTTLPMSQNADVMVLDTVAEVKVDDSAFSAQYGIGGATFNQISKGGTNQFHGAGYEYLPEQCSECRGLCFRREDARLACRVTTTSASRLAVRYGRTRSSSSSTTTRRLTPEARRPASRTSQLLHCSAATSPVFPLSTIQRRRRLMQRRRSPTVLRSEYTTATRFPRTRSILSQPRSRSTIRRQTAGSGITQQLLLQRAQLKSHSRSISGGWIGKSTEQSHHHFGDE